MKYTITTALSLGGDTTLGLTDAQAALRKHVLQPIAGRKGWYLTTGPVQFKVGEQIQCDDELPKALADAVESVEDKQASKTRAKALAREQAEAAAAQAELDAQEQAKRDAEAAQAHAEAQALQEAETAAAAALAASKTPQQA